MESPKIYSLEQYPRLFSFPFPLKHIGWMPHHLCFHRNTEIKDFFVCISANWEGVSERLENGKRVKIRAHKGPFGFGTVLPGTHLNSIKAVYHDELFFSYSPEHGEKLLEFLWKVPQKKYGFYFSVLPEDLIAEIRHELLHLEQPGAADRLDQLAIRLFSEIIISHNLTETTGLSGKVMKIHAIAEELQRGKELKSLLKDHGLSERTFYREWQKVFAESPAEYRISRMIKHACDLLKNTTLKSGEIAEKCGFSNSNYFSQIFRKRKKMSPAEYRKSHSGKLFDVASNARNG